jgi:hypothetical protein
MKNPYLSDQKLKRKKDKLESLVNFEKILAEKIEKDKKKKAEDLLRSILKS